LGEQPYCFSIILKSGDALEEQYRPSGRQEPWTDVYGMAATFFPAGTGLRPPDALGCKEADTLVRPSRPEVGLAPGEEEARLTGLAVSAAQSFQYMKEFYEKMLNGKAVTQEETPLTIRNDKPYPEGGVKLANPSRDQGSPPAPGAPRPGFSRRSWLLPVSFLTVLVVLGLGVWLGWWYFWDGSPMVAETPTVTGPTPAEKGAAAIPEAGSEKDRVMHLVNQGRTFYQEQRFGEAIAKLEEALAIDPGQAEALYYLGCAFIAATRYQEAVETLKLALKSRPDYAPAYEAKGRAYYLLDQFKEAILDLEQALKLDPALTEARYYLGLAHLAEGRRQKAQEQYEALINRAPEKAALLKEHLRESGAQPPSPAVASPSLSGLPVTQGPRWPWTSHRPVTPADLAALTTEELKIMRYEILARKGWVFASPDLRDYFAKQPWYQPKGTQEQAGKVNREILRRLKPLERRNAAAIFRYEMKVRKQIQ
jgi:tetratricopeptide (TPR) repeat protein